MKTKPQQYGRYGPERCDVHLRVWQCCLAANHDDKHEFHLTEEEVHEINRYM